MALIPLQIPAGAYRNGTDYQSSGRWRDTNLVRWIGNALKPVGGWSEKADASASFTSTPRAMHVWVDNSLSAKTAIGTSEELVYLTPSGTAYDITPTGFTAGSDDAAINTAYSGTFYGTSLYGVKRPSIGAYQEVDVWMLDNWGEYLVGCCTSDGNIYEWTGNTASPAAVVTNAPTSCRGLIVTEERFIFALQAGGNPRKVAWCDREDNTTWTPLATNEAGDIELQTSGEIVTAVRMRGRTLILTNTDAHIATYQGAPYVYGFERVGTACGAVSKHCCVAVDQGAFWFGKESFYVFDGSIARQMECDVADYVFDDMNENQSSKIFGVHNSEYGEIWWFYPSQGSLEIDRYVAYSYKYNHWHFGDLARTTGFDQGVFAEPLWVDSTGVIYEHERHGVGHGGLTPFAETAPISIGNGDNVMAVTSVIPDEETQGEVELTFKTRFHPNDTEREYGVYSTGNPTSVRFTGRQVRMRVQATGNEDWRVGTMRLEAKAGGRR